MIYYTFVQAFAIMTLCIYSKSTSLLAATRSTEHLVPQCLFKGKPRSHANDLLNLVEADRYTNSSRSNYRFGAQDKYRDVMEKIDRKWPILSFQRKVIPLNSEMRMIWNSHSRFTGLLLPSYRLFIPGCDADMDKIHESVALMLEKYPYLHWSDIATYDMTR